MTAQLTVEQEVRLGAVADRLDALAHDARRLSGKAGWINNPFCLRLEQLGVELRDEIAAIPGHGDGAS